MSNLPSVISKLSTAEKFELIDALWENLESTAPLLTEAQSAELDDRVANYEQNRSVVAPWDQVKAGLFKKQ